jgi:hypothetical protein
VVVLIASIPLAIEIVTTTTLALGSKVLTVRFAPLLLLHARTHTHELYVFVFVFFGRETSLSVQNTDSCTLKTLTNTQSKGAIVTRLGAIEELAGMDMLCSDKTGTLTLNKMVIEPSDCAFFEPGEDYDSVVFQAALAAKWKEPPRDALDTMVLKVLSLPSLLQLSLPPSSRTYEGGKGVREINVFGAD